MDFERIDGGKEAAFVEHWSAKYKESHGGGFDFAQVSYESADEGGNGTIDYYAELNSDGALTEQNVKRLLRWKDPLRLSSQAYSGANKECPNSRVLRVVSHLDAIRAFREGRMSEADFDAEIGTCFPHGNGVWRVFVKHIARPWDFPIYDRHVWAAYCNLTGRLRNGKPLNVSLSRYGEYRDFFFALYRAVYGTDERTCDIETVKRMKRIDNALFAYDKYREKAAETRA